MRPKEKNQIFELLLNSEFEPNDFDFEEKGIDSNDTHLSIITFLENSDKSKFNFHVLTMPGSFGAFRSKYTKYTPNYDYTVLRPTNRGPYNITELCVQCQLWLNEIKQ